jgi:UDP-glucose 4-epimerase
MPASASILLTGAGGWLGRQLARRLAGGGLRVLAVVRTPASWAGSGLAGIAGIEPVICDLATGNAGLPASGNAGLPASGNAGLPASGNAGLPEHYDWLVHAAGHSRPMPPMPRACLDDNLVATRNLIEHAIRAGARGSLFTSSISVYGEVATPEIDETSPVCNPGVYGLSKLLAEQLFAESAGRLPCLALRLPGLIGPGALTPWLGLVLARILRDEPVTIYHPEAPFNNAVHVADLAELIRGVVSRPLTGFDLVTLGADEPLPVGALIETLFQASGRRVPVSVRAAPGPGCGGGCRRAIARYGYSPMAMAAMAERYVGEILAAPPA